MNIAAAASDVIILRNRNGPAELVFIHKDVSIWATALHLTCSVEMASTVPFAEAFCACGKQYKESGLPCMPSHVRPAL